MAVYVVTVEFDLPDGVDFAVAATPMMDALRDTTPHPPTQVTAYAGDTARAVLAALGGPPPSAGDTAGDAAGQP